MLQHMYKNSFINVHNSCFFVCFFTFLQFFVLHFSDNTEVLFIYFKVLLRGTF